MISRLYNFQTGAPIYPDEWEGELDQLVSEVNTKFASTDSSISESLVVSGTVQVDGELKGDRVSFPFSRSGGNTYASYGDNRYMDIGGNNGSATEISALLPRAGSVVGYGVFSNCYSYGGADPSGSFLFSIRKNAVEIFQTSSISITSAAIRTANAAFTRGTYPFSAGDRLSCLFDLTNSCTSFGYEIVSIEVVFDT